MKKLKFEYCECGCHCFTASSKGIGYTIYDDLKGNLHLVRGHKYGAELGTFKDYEEAEAVAQKDWDDHD